MQKKRQEKIRHLFISKSIKYFAILGIVILMLLPMTIGAYNLAKVNTITQSRHQLERGLRQFDNEIKKSQEMSQMLLKEPEFTSLLRLKGAPQAKHYTMMNQIKKKMASLGQMQDYLVDSIIVFRDNPIVISNWFVSDNYHRIYPRFLNQKNYTAEQWHGQFFEERFFWNFLPIIEEEHYYLLPTTRNILGYQVNTTHAMNIKQQAVVSYQYDFDKMRQEFLLPEIQPDGFLYIEQNGILLASYQYPDTEGISDTENEYATVAGKEYYFFSEQIQSKGLTITIGIPRQVLQQNIRALIMMMLAYLALGIVIVLLLSLFFTSKETMSLQKIIDATSRGNPARGRDTYQFLVETVSTIHTENESYEKRIRMLNETIKTYALEGLLTLGAYTSIEETEVREYFGDSFAAFSTLKIVIDGELLTEGILLLEEEFLYQLPYRHSVTVPRNNEIIVILFLSDTDDSTILTIKQVLLHQMNRFTDKYPSTDITIGISNILSGYSAIRTSYLQAQQALNDNFQKNSSGAYLYGVVKERSAQTVLDTALLLRLGEVLLMGEQAIALQLFEEIGDFIYKQPMAEKEAKQLYYSVSHVVYNAKVNISLVDLEAEAIVVPEYQYNHALETQMRALGEVADSLVKIVNARKDINREYLKEEVFTYLHEQYSNTAMNAVSIAKALSVSEKYVYSLVRERSGKTLGQYIDEIRLEQAEELLLTTDFSNRRIMEEVGFGSENTFYRSFSKKNNMSPAKWKASKKQGLF